MHTKENAEAIVKTLNADKEDDWTYKVKIDEKHTGSTPATIEIYDEDGEFVALLV